MKTLEVFAAASILILVKVKRSAAECPSDYAQVGTRCYRFPPQEHITWYQAYFICQNEMNGHLVEIESQEEQNSLKAYIETVVDPTGRNAYWLGATDLLRENEYRWMTWGNRVTFNAWNTNEPNDAGGVEDCTMFDKAHNYKWFDIECSDHGNWVRFVQKAICETDPNY